MHSRAVHYDSQFPDSSHDAGKSASFGFHRLRAMDRISAVQTSPKQKRLAAQAASRPFFSLRKNLDQLPVPTAAMAAATAVETASTATGVEPASSMEPTAG